jgi:hypothetical protein
MMTLGNDVVNDIAMHIGESKIATSVAERKLCVIEP